MNTKTAMGKRLALVISTRLRSWIEAAHNARTRSMNVSSTVHVVILPRQQACTKQEDVDVAETIHHLTVGAGSHVDSVIPVAG